MAGERAAKTYLEQTIELLWRTKQPGTRGPRSSLTLDQVVSTAIGIADAEGLAAVTMRRVADALGVTTMSLYRYVPGKEDLVGLMMDAASEPPDTGGWPTDWRGRLTAWARGQRAILQRRPWLLDIPISGPPVGPNSLTWMEAALAAMVDTDLHEDDMMGVLSILTGYILTESRQELTMGRAAPRTGVTPAEWNRAYGSALRRVAGAERFPTVARVVDAGVFDEEQQGPDVDFEYGLSFLLDGVAALIHTRREEGAGRG